MSTRTDTPIPAVPQTERVAQSTATDETQGLWQQLLAPLSQVGNVIDPFASDTHAEVRSLGRRARQATPRIADDYFALGDMCARLTLDTLLLNLSYAEKTIIAYNRAGECSIADTALAQAAILDFVHWIVEVAQAISNKGTLQVGTYICERAVQSAVITTDEAAIQRIRQLERQLRAQLHQLVVEDVDASEDDSNATPQRLSQRLCDEGQMLLRQQQTTEALAAFDRAIEADAENSGAWLWRAIALTDVARFDEALVSYGRVTQIDPANYGAWNSKGELLLELGRAEEALACFEQALMMPVAPAVVRAAFLLNKGKALYMLRRYAEARAALVEADQLDHTPESAGGIAACDEMLGDERESG